MILIWNIQMSASMKEELGLCRPKLAILTTVFEKTKGLYNVQCILMNIPGTAFEIFLIALMYSRIPLSPDNLKTVIKYQTFQTLFHRPSFESVANIVSSFETNLG